MKLSALVLPPASYTPAGAPSVVVLEVKLSTLARL